VKWPLLRNFLHGVNIPMLCYIIGQKLIYLSYFLILWDLRVDGCVILLCPARNYDAKNVSCYVLQGVMMSHRNIVSTIVGVTASVPKLSTNDIYLAYLPLAHILELTGEVMNPCDIGMQGLGNLL
jgi:hypothetical protein